MPLEQTVTIINKSGNVISTGKHLVNIFKEAKFAYREKKESLKREREASGIRRAQTFHSSPSGPAGGHNEAVVEEFDDGFFQGPDGQRSGRRLGNGPQRHLLEEGDRKSQADGDGRSRALISGNSVRRLLRSSSIGASSHRNRNGHDRDRDGESGTGRRSSRPPLTSKNLRAYSEVSATSPSIGPLRLRRSKTSQAGDPSRPSYAPSEIDTASQPAMAQGLAALSNPRRSDPGDRKYALSKPIDMNLAYGDVPPDLADRQDLDPVPRSAGINVPAADDDGKEATAQSLIDQIEFLLTEAQCIHHSATSIIAHLQNSPDAAAAVALTLAELSAVLAKLGPAFLGVIKGGSPAVFALLASPQFLIGTSIAVGVTIVAFGGWKIVKRISDTGAAIAESPMAFGAGTPAQARQQNNTPSVAGSVDEALVLEEELSTIESWRRGIMPTFGTDGGPGYEIDAVVDAELISPEAMRSRIGDDDGRRSVRSRFTSRSNKGSRSHHHGKRQSSHSPDSKDKAGEDSRRVPERKSSAKADSKPNGKSAPSEAGSCSTNRNRTRSRRPDLSPSEKSGARSVVTSTPSVKDKEKKEGSGGNMLKQLFKKKRDKEDKDRSETQMSVLV